ncbi:MAG: alpha/beta hydrolase [archaeon]
MKNAIIIYGTSCTPDSYWLPSIKRFLEKKDYDVFIPILPDGDIQNLKTQLPFILKNGKFDKNTILIGHSSGCPLILSMLENIDVKIDKAILVAGLIKSSHIHLQKIFQKVYNAKKIKENAKEIIFINSDNDPWGCDHNMGLKMLSLFGGTLVVPHNEGHFGSEKYKQPYKKFPLIEKLIIG